MFKKQNNPRFRVRLCVLVKLKIIDHMATLEYKIDKRKKINNNEVVLWYLYIIYTS